MEFAHAITDMDGRFVEADAAFCSILQLSPVELFNLTILDVTSGAGRSINQDLLHILIERGGGFVIEKNYVRSDGSSIPVRNYVSRTLDRHGNTRIAASIMDLTRTKSVRQMLDDANQRARNIREQTDILRAALRERLNNKQ